MEPASRSAISSSILRRRSSSTWRPTGACSKVTMVGPTWPTPAPGWPASTCGRIAFDPADPDHLFVASGAGVFESINAGGTWSARNSGLSTLDVLSIGVQSASVLYAGTDGGGLYASSDSGATWQRKTASVPAEIRALELVPAAPVTVLAATEAGLFASVDGGATWSENNGRLAYTITVTNAGPSNAIDATVEDFFPPTLSCEWSCTGSGGGVCSAGPVSGDLVDTVDLPGSASVVYTALCAIDPSATGAVDNTATVTAPDTVSDSVLANNTAMDSATLVRKADLAITKDDGVTSVVPGGDVTYTLTATNQGGSDAVGATVSDLFAADLACTWTCSSTAGPSFWTSLSDGLEGDAQAVRAAAFDPGSAMTAWIATEGGVFKTTDGGLTWTEANTGLTSLDVLSIAVDRMGRPRSTPGPRPASSRAATAGPVGRASTAPPVSGAASALRPQRVRYAVRGDRRRRVQECRQYRIPQLGRRQLGSRHDGCARPGGRSEHRPDHSVRSHEPRRQDQSDGGSSWTTINTGLSSFDVRAITVDPPGGSEARASRLYAATAAGISRSLNGGTSWALANSGLTNPTVRQLVVDLGSSSTPESPRPVYAATAGRVSRASTPH